MGGRLNAAILAWASNFRYFLYVINNLGASKLMKTYLFRPATYEHSTLEASEDSLKSVWIEVELNPEDLLNLNQVVVKTGLSKATIQRRIQEGIFPRSDITDIHGRKNYWSKVSVLGWIDLQKHNGRVPDAFLKTVLSDETDDAIQALEERGDYVSRTDGDAIFEMTQKIQHDFDAFCKDYPHLKGWAESRRYLFTKGRT
jgi:predicted DNA-binding transcriptional regulator AlpA